MADGLQLVETATADRTSCVRRAQRPTASARTIHTSVYMLQYVEVILFEVYAMQEHLKLIIPSFGDQI